jgi:aryl-alcohol dehydrogenase-like predicted oxidoreductase
VQGEHGSLPEAFPVSVSKLILGTAGLSGQQYGRDKRTVDLPGAIAVLQKAYDLGIRMFDTSPSYGHAEKALGMARKQWSEPVTIFSKSSGEIKDILASAISLGTTPKILHHNWEGNSTHRWCVGVSTYSNDKFKGSRKPPSGIVQIDWNILNQHTYMATLDRTFHCRSVFAQGVLAFGPIPRVNGEPTPNAELKAAVERAAKFATALGVSLKALALVAALEHPQFAAVLIGAQSSDEVIECVAIAKMRLDLYPTILALDLGKPELTDPRRWL